MFVLSNIFKMVKIHTLTGLNALDRFFFFYVMKYKMTDDAYFGAKIAENVICVCQMVCTSNYKYVCVVIIE